jgi:hypothetical protein
MNMSCVACGQFRPRRTGWRVVRARCRVFAVHAPSKNGRTVAVRTRNRKARSPKDAVSRLVTDPGNSIADSSLRQGLREAIRLGSVRRARANRSSEATSAPAAPHVTIAADDVRMIPHR